MRGFVRVFEDFVQVSHLLSVTHPNKRLRRNELDIGEFRVLSKIQTKHSLAGALLPMNKHRAFLIRQIILHLRGLHQRIHNPLIIPTIIN